MKEYRPNYYKTGKYYVIDDNLYEPTDLGTEEEELEKLRIIEARIDRERATRKRHQQYHKINSI